MSGRTGKAIARYPEGYRFGSAEAAPICTVELALWVDCSVIGGDNGPILHRL